MLRFTIEQKHPELTSHAGLALAGLALNRYSEMARKVDRGIALRHGIPHSDILRTYTRLLCMGKNDFEAVNNVHGDDFFSDSLDIGLVPSEATLRQRFDEQAETFLPYVTEASIDFLANKKGFLPCKKRMERLWVKASQTRFYPQPFHAFTHCQQSTGNRKGVD